MLVLFSQVLVDGANVTPWSPWSSCSVTCGYGSQWSQRQCDKGNALLSRTACSRTNRSRSCVEQLCQGNILYNEYISYSPLNFENSLVNQ